MERVAKGNECSRSSSSEPFAFRSFFRLWMALDETQTSVPIMHIPHMNRAYPRGVRLNQSWL